MKKVTIAVELYAWGSNHDWIIVFESHPEYKDLRCVEKPLDETDERMKALGYNSYTFNDLKVLDKAG